MYGERLVHGMFLASLVSCLVGMHLPGSRSVCLSQSFDFVGPVYAGDEVEVIGEVVKKQDATQTLVIRTEVLALPDRPPFAAKPWFAYSDGPQGPSHAGTDPRNRPLTRSLKSRTLRQRWCRLRSAPRRRPTGWSRSAGASGRNEEAAEVLEVLTDRSWYDERAFRLLAIARNRKQAGPALMQAARAATRIAPSPQSTSFCRHIPSSQAKDQNCTGGYGYLGTVDAGPASPLLLLGYRR